MSDLDRSNQFQQSDISDSFLSTQLLGSSLTPLDGRYKSKLEDLEGIVSDKALSLYRIKVELNWLDYLLSCSFVSSRLNLDGTKLKEYRTIISSLLDTGLEKDFYIKLKQIESRTNHDVKSVELYLRSCLESKGVDSKVLAYIHFGCTSEDINNISYAMMISDAVAVLKQRLKQKTL